ncbi:beta-aspartyl-peptidase [Anaeromicrobium sediminis]|uniref:Isoaspartyl dipeptidase n=1 Tax=Anaeromicrobium sediminis TaxID=1478221 RepID=A0A267MAX2_9FIRM|nr:beta-aspartyl-peptidase [Anaeromicrobium sediminis]PAB56731.1 beta-aspartyl-peptidase [Anaeromicrobium sediminis]
MILIKNIQVYTPKYIGKKDVLLGGEKILRIDDMIHMENDKVEILDGTGKKMVPGFIDQHVHITGGGGEGSFKTRVPEITLSKLTKGGITTVLGLLGTDGTTRSIENLVAKAKGLKEEGLSVYLATGSYEYPTITLTESIKKDILFIDEIIGVKIALSDHRSSHVTKDQLKQVASEARVAGMLSDKAGIVIVHMGNGKKGLKPIKDIINDSDLPIGTIRPTHVNRKVELLHESFEFAKEGGYIDLTCGIYEDLRPGKVIKMAIEENVPMDNITISSDGYGSWSKYDSKGNMTQIGVSQVDTLYEEFKYMVKSNSFEMEEALRFFTSNVAKGLKLYPKKGSIEEGSCGDVLIVDENLDIDTVIARGKIMILNKDIIVRGTYE